MDSNQSELTNWILVVVFLDKFLQQLNNTTNVLRNSTCYQQGSVAFQMVENFAHPTLPFADATNKTQRSGQ